MPENWKTYKLGQLLKVKHGFAFKGKSFTTEPNDNLLLTPGNFEKDGGIKFNWGKQKFYTGKFPTDYILQQNSLVIAMTDLTQACDILGAPLLIKDSKFNYLHNQRLGLIQEDEKLVSKHFLFYYFNSRKYRDRLVATKTGSTVSHTAPERIYDCEIELPPLQEQKSIASILSALDDKIELNLHMNKTLEEMAMALYKHWFVDFGPFQDGEFVATELGEIPKGWEVKRFGDFTITTDFVANGSFKSLKDNVTTFDTPEYGLYIRLVDYNNGFSSNLKYVDRKSFDFLKKSKINGKEIIISNVGANAGTVFRPPVWLEMPMTLGSNSIMVKENNYTEILYQYFLSYYGQDALKNIMSGSAQPKFNKTDFRNMKIALPDSNSISVINNNLITIQKSITQNKAENQTLTQLRDTLLPKLISGEVRVKDAEKTLSEVL